MKKFKHRKTGEIAIYKDGVLKSSGFAIELGVEPSSNFWEEMIEKDYEILSFIRNESSQNYKGTIFIKDENNTYNPSFKHSGLTLEHCLNGGFNIHSVKRLSDS